MHRDNLKENRIYYIEKGSDYVAGGDTYKEIRTMELPGMFVRLFIPDLTQEEQNRRMRNIHNAAASLLMSVDKAAAKKA